MEQATILMDGNVVRTKDFTSLIFNTNGHLVSFKVTDTGVSYSHFIDVTNKIPAGYYNREKYLDYKAEITGDVSGIIKFNAWKKAEINDEIIIKKRKITYSSNSIIGNNTYCWNEYRKVFTRDLFFSDKEIDVSTFIINPLNSACGNDALVNTAIDFFNNNIINSELGDSKFINIIGNISQLINNIELNIFNAFESSDFPDSLKEEQLSLWSLNFAVNYLDYDDLKKNYENYYSKLNDYYESVKNYLNYINNGTDLVKAIALGSSVHPSVLQQISVQKKIDIINFISDEFFINDEIINFKGEYYELKGKKGYLTQKIIQNFIVNLTMSFSPQDTLPNADQENKSNIDIFLEALLSKKKDGYILKDELTIFELIYNNLNQPYNITEVAIGVTNWVASTNFKPNGTKERFIQGLYMLWQFSKFNPFDLQSNDIKDNTISFKHVDNSATSLVDFTISSEESLYIYSHEIGYVSYTTTETQQIGDPQTFNLFKERANALDTSPLVIPYESNKTLKIFNDNFRFTFKENKIHAYQTGLPIDTYFNDEWNQHFRKSGDLLYGVYDIYQPVTIINTNLDTKSPLYTITGNETEIDGTKINSLIPIFVLKYIDDAGDQSDAETMLGFLVDGVLTFSGIGNLAKLRHLRWAVFGGEMGLSTKTVLRVTFGAVEFSAGVIGFFANFVECSPPTEPENSENAEAWAEYRFCESMQNFIRIFQIATLSITAGDSIASLAMQKAAKRVTDSAGGGLDAVTLRQNVENRLQALDNTTNPALRTQVADKIVMCSIIPIPLSQITNLIDKIKDTFKKRITVSWSLHPDYTNIFLTDYIRLCKQELGLTDDIITDLVVIANRRKITNGIWDMRKYINPAELERQTIFHIKEILKRGYCAGFTNLNNYKLYCNAMRNRFIQNLDEIMPDSQLSSFINSLECSIQGSATRGLRAGDPAPVNNITIPLRKVDDIDAAFSLNNLDFDSFCDELIRIGREMDFSDQLIKDLIKQKTDGKIMYDLLKEFKFGNSDFTTLIRNAAKPYTGFPPKKINFAIIKKGGQYDNLPQLSFKY